MGQLERPPELVVGVETERVQVETERSTEHERLLRYDGQLLTQIMQTELADVHVVYQDLALWFGALEQSKQSQSECRFAGACATNNAYLYSIYIVDIRLYIERL